MTITFRDEQHREDYLELLSKMKSQSRYNQAVAYLLTLDSECSKHISDLYDIDTNKVKPFGATALAWQTGTSIKTTRLMLNLWDGYFLDLNKDESAEEKTHGLYSADEIFCCSYALYYFEAIKLRYPEYIDE